MIESDKDEQFNDLVKLSFFSEVGKAISSATTVSQTLKAVMDQIGVIFAPSYWSLLLRNPKTGDLKFSVVVGSGVENLKGQIIPRGKGIAGWIAEHGESLIIEDVSRDSRFAPDMDEMNDFKTESIIGVPLKNGNRVFGVIELINKLDGQPFSPLELQLLTTVADFAAIAIEKAYYMNALRKVATVDPLTGLNNRRSFEKYFYRESDRCRRNGRTFTVMMIDIDGFKQITDSYGHKEGDRVLCEVADLLQTRLRSADLPCRYGGDEFIILMPDTSLKEAKILKQRLLDLLEETNRNRRIPVSMSIGIHEADDRNLSEVMHMADKDMYRQKNRKAEMTIGDLPEHIEEFMEPCDGVSEEQPVKDRSLSPSSEH